MFHKQEHFLAEIATIRKRLMTIEDGTKLSGVAETTKAHIQSMTDIGADAKGEEVSPRAFQYSRWGHLDM